MANKKMPAPRRAGTSRVGEFAVLALELAVLNPRRFEKLSAEMLRDSRTDTKRSPRSHIPNEIH